MSHSLTCSLTVFVVPDTKVALKFNATTPSARQLETSPFSLTTVSNPISEIELEKLVTLAPPTTIGSTSTTHKAVAVPIDRETEPQNTQLQVTSASPTTGGQGATPRGRKVMPKEGTSEPYATTTASAVVDVAMKETASAPEEKDHPPAAPTLPPPATTMPSWAEPNPASSTPLLSDYGRINEDIVPGVATNVGSEVRSAGPASVYIYFLTPSQSVIAGGIVGLAFAVMLVSLMVYRMKKKDEGSYSLDEQKHPNSGYQKPHKQEEFLA
uniref:Syndecan n=1 Tax=Scleropages formosus TaxID=113540 RepID=A0A8C9WAX2_SCLFO